MTTSPSSESGALVSDDGVYRYVLWRRIVGVRPEKGPLLWVMLNPSTADATVDDPTIRKVVGFTRRWGYDEARVVNLWAYRSTDWKALRDVADPVGPENDVHIAQQIHLSSAIVLAWGRHAAEIDRAQGTRREATSTISLLSHRAHRPVVCLGTTRGNAPRHPLRVSYAVTAEDMELR